MAEDYLNDIVSVEVKDSRIRTEFVSFDGLSFEVDKCGQGDKLAICLHGFPEHSFSWRYQLPMLADLGYEAWAPNLRGYGKSSRPPSVNDYTMTKLMDDVAGLIDASGHKEVVLIAHDWGAVIAWQFAIKKIRPLNKLIICNVPHPGPMKKAFKKGWAQLKKSWYIFFFQIPHLPEYLLGKNDAEGVGDAILNSAVLKKQFPPEILAVYRRNASQPGALTAMLNYYRALFRDVRQSSKEDIPMIQTPTLMIWGEEDVALTKESTYGTDEFVENFTIRYLPNISHWVQQEAPSEVNAMMAAFIRDEKIPEMTWKMILTDPID
ncbi:MAG: alpha/beta hydrolase [Pseudomonadales bacterium]|nr:alpha/beta hydrolase [Pseudomonadales bacterium]